MKPEQERVLKFDLKFSQEPRLGIQLIGCEWVETIGTQSQEGKC